MISQSAHTIRGMDETLMMPQKKSLMNLCLVNELAIVAVNLESNIYSVGVYL